jgi:peptide-methionine (S)-S-oxide reductase
MIIAKKNKLNPGMFVAALMLFILQMLSCGSNKTNTIENMNNTNNGYQVATLGGGCFWCIEAIYLDVKGVISATSGYSGGKIKNPTYREVTSGLTGHAEVVQIVFDPDVITYHDILTIFFHVHDPTTLNRQGADVGTQYRSVIFYHDETQQITAQAVIREIEDSKIWPGRIVTELSPLTAFYIAEDYHQDYFANNPNQPYCTFVISPKVEKFRKNFGDFLKE